MTRRIASKITPKKANIYLPEFVEESELDRFKKIIANTGETKISLLHNFMKINIKKLNDLMNDLVGEGWLESPKTKQSGYRLTMSEEKLAKGLS
ncbi:hypothetical protein ACIQV0_10440 [Lysinibacillus capsici]|uniref:hypothetical protein n=1 Tax=Lysinibacillus capsici TaxID=2115968 RepID=UPI00382BA40E